jgi:hypothetical protein
VTYAFSASSGQCLRYRTPFTGSSASADFTSGVCQKGGRACTPLALASPFRDAAWRAENQPQINALPVKQGSVLLRNLGPPFPNCRVIYFDAPFSDAAANIIVTTTVNHASGGNSGISSWTTAVDSASFTVCVREFKITDATHPDLILNYLAAVRNATSLAVATAISQSALWSTERGSQCVRMSASLSQRASMVLVTVNFPTPALNAWPTTTGVAAWVEEVDWAGWRVCAATTGAAYVPAFVAAYDLHVIAFGPNVSARRAPAGGGVLLRAPARACVNARSPWPSVCPTSATRP